MELNESAATLKGVMAYFGMTSQQMQREWKAMTDLDKIQLRNGIGDGSLTY